MTKIGQTDMQQKNWNKRWKKELKSADKIIAWKIKGPIIGMVNKDGKKYRLSNHTNYKIFKINRSI